MTRYTVATVPPNHFAWMTERTGVTLTADFSAIAAVDSDRREPCRYCGQEHEPIRGMVAYSDVTPSSAHLHVVFEHPIAMRTLQQVALPYLFEVADKEVALAQVRASNARVRRLVEHLGFRRVATLPGAYQHNEDLIIYRLDRADWRRDHGGEG